MNRGLLAALTSAVAAATISGCSGAAETPSHSASEAAISQQQTDALKDGDVSWDEYQTAFKAYQACLREAGFTLSDPRVVDDLMDFGIPGVAVDSGADDKCYQFNWSRVDDAWQIAHEDTSPSAKLVSACLQAKGITPRTKYRDNVELLKQSGIDVSECSTGD